MVLVEKHMGTTTHHWSDTLISDVCLCCSIVLDQLPTLFVNSSPDAIDLLVDFGTMVITLLT